MENSGEVDLPLAEVAILDGNNANAYQITNLGSWPAGTVLAAGETRTLSVRYAPFSGTASPTAQNAELKITVDAAPSYPASGHPTLALNGVTQWLPSAALFDASLGARLDAAGEANLNYGDVPIGTQTDLTARLRNLGLGDLQVREVCFVDSISGDCTTQGSSAHFSFSPLGVPPDIPSNSDQSYVFTFAPQSITLNDNELSPSTAAVRIATFDPVVPNITVNLTGRPTNPIFAQSPSTYDFGGVYPGQTQESGDLVITNTGYGALTLNAIELTGSSSNDFELPAGAARHFATRRNLLLSGHLHPRRLFRRLRRRTGVLRLRRRARKHCHPDRRRGRLPRRQAGHQRRFARRL